jgi:hypothetical protein
VFGDLKPDDKILNNANDEVKDGDTIR